ncbi:LOW QUALITY PROTEIN: F-box/WD repeat-containing protein 12 [Marmota marmota marmota]|uniref:LOW QUALITY PROTEIN: F-box/WD repeat-containing protein 12 n=1 Tax=Marmota marmota marmota TaxID=9994 RepID=UPI00209291BF|nr:LOW QUALITY PROTEIN: F-box/WD repeat-containing protein 12 [Marmota marmota marmota]
MEIELPDVPLVKIFSYLDALSLLQASQVSKGWNKVAESDLLWRRMCLKKWHFCNFTYEHLGTQTWKQLFLHQTKQEHRMACAQPEDFIYKEAAGNLGILGPVAYVSGSRFTLDEQGKSIICIVSSMRKLYTWDVQEGTMIWSSPVQQFNITNLETLPQMHLEITADMGENKWNCRDRDPLATCAMAQICFSLNAFLTKDGPFLMVGDSDGNIHTFTIPELRDISEVHAFQHSIDILHCSPDKKWVFSCGIHQHIFSKVGAIFFTECLLRPSEHSTPLYFTLPFASCNRGCWTPRRKNGITLMYRRGSTKKTGFTTFDLTTESPEAHQIASFLLPVHIDSPNWMGVSDGSIIVVESGPYLFLFTINGLMLERCEGHQSIISNIWVDSLHILAASMDCSLHVYMWEEGGYYPYLKKCCHLEYLGNSLTPSCSQVSRAICDNMSIVRVVSRAHESNILVINILNV